MKKVLILGAGMVAKPIVEYLLKLDIPVTVADLFVHKAEELTKKYKLGIAVGLKVEDDKDLDLLIASHDLIVSLLPYAYHVKVATFCIKHKKNMVTTSYVKPAMQALDNEAKEAGIIILNEVGLDPGIDHMSAMRIIDHVHNRKGKVEAFYSLCGALPAPEAANNPFKYKFSWSPKGVVMAGNNDAKYLKNNVAVETPTKDLFKDIFLYNFPDVERFDVYPNRDSLEYKDIYGIPEAKTIFRGTFRYSGWCETLDAIKSLRLLSNDTFDFTGKTYSEMVALLIGADNAKDIKQKAAGCLKLNVESYAVNALEWLGVFDNVSMNRKMDSPFEITSDLMIAKMELGFKERDMVALQHVILASYPDGKQEVIKSRMLDFGSPATDTAIARTVALPAAVAVKMILDDKIKVKGVYRPVLPEIYNPILESLEEMNIKMIEEYDLPLSEMIK